MRNLLVCKLSHYLISISTESVVEVTRIVAAEQAPGLPSGIVGLCLYNANVVFVVDLHSMLKVPGETYGASARMLIVQVNDMYLGIMVDAVVNIFSDVEMESRSMERFPSSLRKRVFCRAHKYGGRYSFELDPLRLLHPREQAQLTRHRGNTTGGNDE